MERIWLFKNAYKLRRTEKHCMGLTSPDVNDIQPMQETKKMDINSKIDKQTDANLKIKSVIYFFLSSSISYVLLSVYLGQVVV